MGRARRRKQLSKKLKEAPKFNEISEESLTKWQALFIEERQASAKEEMKRWKNMKEELAGIKRRLS